MAQSLRRHSSDIAFFPAGAVEFAVLETVEFDESSITQRNSEGLLGEVPETCNLERIE